MNAEKERYELPKWVKLVNSILCDKEKGEKGQTAANCRQPRRFLVAGQNLYKPEKYLKDRDQY